MSENAPVPSLKVLLIYNDFASATRANAALQQWGRTSGTGVQWRIQPWRVDILKFPSLADEALVDARDAHLLVFIEQCANTIPFWLEEWLEDWAGIRQFQDSVLAVINSNSIGLEWLPVSQALSDFAKRHCLELFLGCPGNAVDVVSPLGFAQTEAKLHTNNLTEPILRELSQNSNRGWGLNE